MLIFKIIVKNLKNKVIFFGKWKENSKIVKNWFFLYLVTTSLTLEILSRIKITKKIINKMIINVKYKNGNVFSVFFDKYNELHSFIYIYDLYLANFKKYTNKDIVVNAGDIAIDLGGHVGSFSLFFMLNNPEAKLYTYEAEFNNYCLIKRNFEQNLIYKYNYKIENYGVYKEETILNFSIGNSSTIGSITDTGFFKQNGKNNIIQIRTKTIEQIFKENNIKKCKILKMDIEGSEYSIFYNIDDKLLSKIENMIIEVHPTKEYKPIDLKTFLQKKGFNIEDLAYSNGCYDFYCYR